MIEVYKSDNDNKLNRLTDLFNEL